MSMAMGICRRRGLLELETKVSSLPKGSWYAFNGGLWLQTLKPSTQPQSQAPNTLQNQGSGHATSMRSDLCVRGLRHQKIALAKAYRM